MVDQMSPTPRTSVCPHLTPNLCVTSRKHEYYFWLISQMSLQPCHAQRTPYESSHFLSMRELISVDLFSHYLFQSFKTYIKIFDLVQGKHRNLILTFYMQISCFPNIICWRGCPISNVFWQLCQESVSYTWGRLLVHWDHFWLCNSVR